MARRQRNHSRHGPRQTPQSDDGLQDWQEWLDHQYVPGYYVGGRVPPFLRRSGHPSRTGWALAVVGAVTVAATVLTGLRGGGFSLPGTAFGGLLGALEVGAGLRLTRPRRRR